MGENERAGRRRKGCMHIYMRERNTRGGEIIDIPGSQHEHVRSKYGHRQQNHSWHNQCLLGEKYERRMREEKKR